MNPGSLYSELIGKIGRVRRRETGVALQTAFLNTFGAVVGTWILALTLEALFHFDAPVRAGLYWTAVAVTAASVALFLARPAARALGLLRAPDDDAIATRVGLHIPDVGDRLVNTLQLYRSRNAGALALGYSPELIEESILTQGEPLRHYDYDVIVELENRRRALLFFAGAVVLAAGLLSVAAPAYGEAFVRLQDHRTIVNPAAPFSMSIAPGDVKVIRGDSVAITVRTMGIPPRAVRIHTRTEGDAEFQQHEIRSDSAGVFHYTLTGVSAATSYYASSGYTRTQSHVISVTEHPEIRLLQVIVGQPGRRAERLPDNRGDVTALRGSGVSIRVETTVPVARGSVVQLFPRSARVASTVNGASPPVAYDTVRVPMRVDGSAMSGGFRVQRDSRYFIEAISADGLRNTSPIVYSVAARIDGAPTIALIQPTGRTMADPSMLLPTQVQISDDYGFSRLRLFYRLSASRFEEPWSAFRSVAIPIPSGSPSSLEVPYVWNMTGLNLVPEDELEVFFEVADNDPTGAKAARTEKVVVRLPALDEIFNDAEEVQKAAQAELEKVMRNAELARKEMEQVHRELLQQLAQSQGSNSWQQQQQLKQLMDRHEQMEKGLQEMAENLRTMSERLQQAQAISPETLKKYAELQKLFQETKDPAMRRAMEQMQKAMEQMTPQQIAEAMKNYEFNEEQFRASIERTMKVLERMQAEQKVDEMVRRAEELAEKQKELNERMKNTDAAQRQELTERQKQLAKEAERLEQEVKDLAEKMSEMPDMPSEEMQQAEQELAENGPQEPMDQAAQEMQQGDMQEAQQQGQKAQQRAESFRKKMQDIKKKMEDNSQKQVAQKMKKALQDLLELSRREEDLKKRTDAAPENSPQFRDLAREQAQTREDLENVTDQLAELSQKTLAVTPEMGKELGDALRSMSDATRSLEQRDGKQASKQEGDAMGSLNRAAMMLQNSIAQQQGQQQGGGGGGGMQSFQQRMQEMAAQQQMINMAMGQQMGGSQGDGQGQGQGKQKGQGKQGEGEGEGQGEGENGKDGKMKRLAQQQGDVKKSLDDLNKEARESGGTRKNVAADLERAAREIEEVLKDIRTGRVSSETRQRQDRILSRMLDAVRSVRERDFEKERESKPGQNVVRASPPNLNLPEPKEVERAVRDALRGREAGYAKDYEYLIKNYFERLGRGPN